jgi:hypothetical protein
MLEKDMSRLFISYSRQDTTAIDPLAKSLEAAGHTVWIDRSVIEVGSRWQAEIVRGIERADVFLLMLTPASVQSENVERELGSSMVPLLRRGSGIRLTGQPAMGSRSAHIFI